MKWIASFVMLVLCLAQQTGCASGNAIYATEYRIQGVLVDATTREPLADQRVLPAEGGLLRLRDSSPKPTTDEQGHFVLLVCGPSVCRPFSGFAGFDPSEFESPPLHGLNLLVTTSDGNGRVLKIDVADAQQSKTKDGVRFVDVGTMAVP